MDKFQTKSNLMSSRMRHGGPTSSQSRFASKRSHANISASRRSVTLSEGKLEAKTAVGHRLGITVFDEDGNDVTPKPLHTYDVTGQKGYLGGDNSSTTAATPTDAMSFASFYPNATATAASVYAQPFSRSVFGSTSGRSVRSKKSSIESSGEITESGAGEITTGFGEVTTVRRDEIEVPTEEELNKIVDIILEETDTIWLFDQKGVAISTESEEAQIIKNKNATYEELCKSKEGNDRYAERGMQTFNDAQKNKEIQADRVKLSDVGVMVTTWDVHDTYSDTALTNGGDKEESVVSLSGINTAPPKLEKTLASVASTSTFAPSESRASFMASSAMIDGDHDFKSLPSVEEIVVTELENGDNPYWEKISNGSSIKHNLVVMERVVTENIYQPKQAAYRGYEVLLDPEKITDIDQAKVASSPAIMSSIGPTLDRLWSYNCSITNGRNVSSMTWNKVNSDLLAVGYGQFGFNEQSKPKGGLACCWNLKNPEYPERVFHCKSSVTALDFSFSNPNLLAVGLYDGSVYIYNVRNNVDQPAVDSFDCAGKHSAPIWQLCWIERDKGVGDERGEILVSISADGRIVQWSIRKGFECTDLMKLKRTGTKNASKKKDKTEAFISRQAPGMCFDFNPNDTNMYIAGTEEGLIHKCSCSYNEQFLDTYKGHTGPLYKLKWSPFAPDVFLSCSADWSIRLWSQTELKPVLNFFSTTKVVHDICWSPYADTVFCAVNEGAVEIWDLNINTLDPLILHLASPGTKFSCCAFSTNSNSVLIGDSDGQVSVYQLKNISSPAEKSNALATIIETTLSNQSSRPTEKENENK